MDQQSKEKSDKILQLSTESISLAQAVKKSGHWWYWRAI